MWVLRIDCRSSGRTVNALTSEMFPQPFRSVLNGLVTYYKGELTTILTILLYLNLYKVKNNAKDWLSFSTTIHHSLFNRKSHPGRQGCVFCLQHNLVLGILKVIFEEGNKHTLLLASQLSYLK